MYRLVSDEYINMINSNVGVLSARLELGESSIESDLIYNVTCETAACPEKLSVGNFVMPKFTFSLSKKADLPLVISGLKATFYIGLSSDGIDFEYAPVCTGRVTSVTQKGELYELVAQSELGNKLDRVYNSSLTFPATSYEVLNEISSAFGIEIILDSVSEFVIESELLGYSCREVIASIAERSGVNAFVSRDDSSIVFKWFEETEANINVDCINEPSLSVETVCYKGVTCINGSELLTLGEEPFLTLNNVCGFIKSQDDLVPVLNAVSSIVYSPGTVNLILGNTLFDPWDIVSIIVENKLVKLPVCNLSHKYDGGLTTEIRIPDQEKTASDGTASAKTSAERAVERLTADLINTKLVMADKVSVGIIEADVANISSILAGNVGAGSLQTISLTANNALVSDLFVKNTIAQYLTVADLQAGDINTSKFRVVSESGNLLISDNTLKISDELSTTRVQLGKDALGDYSLYVWDAQGNLMFDALGVHEAGIKSGIIRDDMVSETANISAGKLNIDSLFTAINSDGSHTLNASKVLLDANAQTLDVAFGALNTKITDVDNRVSTMGTELGILQGQITSKIWEQDITTAINGVKSDITALSTSYSSLSQDVSSFKTEVAETYTTNEEFDDAFDVHRTANGSPITISDSAEAQLEGLKVYGNSIQNGTPTPETPVEIVSVKNPTVKVNGKNLLNITGTTQTKNGITCTVNADKSITLEGTATAVTTFVTCSTLPALPVGTAVTLKPNGDITGAYVQINYKNTAGTEVSFMQVTDRTTGQTKTTTVPANFSTFTYFFVGVRQGSTVNTTIRPQLEVGTVATEYEPYKEAQTLSITTDGLCGVPVSSGGNYTDTNGQQWICDKIDLARGVKVQRIEQIVFDGTEELLEPSTTTVIGTENSFFYTLLTNDAMGSGDNDVYGISKCTHFPVGSVLTSNTNIAHQIRLPSATSKWRLSIRPKDAANMTLETFKTWLAEQHAAGSPVTVQYVLATPIETPLTDEEIAAYKSLKTNYPFTTVLVNDGAGIELDYRRYTRAIDFATTSYTNAAIEQSADEIKQSVSASVEALDGRLSTAESSITVNAGNIAQKVSSSDYNGEKIASLINQSASTVTINASHIKLEGVVTANEGFKIDTDGSMKATSGKIGSFLISNSGIRNSDNTFAIVPATDGNRVIGVGGTSTSRNLGIFSDGTVKIGPDSSNRLVLNSGNIDFYYGSSYNGRLGQPFGDAPGFENCDLYLSTNNKYLYGRTAEGYVQRMLGITAAGNMVLSAPTNSAKLYLYSSEEMYFYLGSTRVLAMEQNGLRFANDKGILLNEKIAMRYYDSAVYCGAQSEPLKLVGSTVTSNGASVTSDARLKNHIAPLDEKYTALLGVLEPKQYMYNSHNTGTTNVGFIAQEVLEALSNVGLTTQDFGGFVDVYGDGREYALDYMQFIPILWATVQKLILKGRNTYED